MNKGFLKYYFSTVKFGGIICIMAAFLIEQEKYLSFKGRGVLLFALFLTFAVAIELTDKRKYLWAAAEIVFWLLLMKGSKEYAVFLIPVVLVDSIVSFKLLYAAIFLGYLGVFAAKENTVLYLLAYSAYLIIQFQRIFIIQRYQEYVSSFEDTENALKTSIDKKDSFLKKEMEQKSLYYENRILEERSRLSQALHDKLGHNINGAVYQMEAAKLLVEKKPEESVRILQAVISSLRTSMDEIRIILRREKPDKAQMALVQLQGLCNECIKKYGIQMILQVAGEKEKVSEEIWEVILDNGFEAVSNALKYANCSEIKMDIQIMPKAIRCSIIDNGNGCKDLKEGMGINGMKQRIRQVNGIIDVETEYGFKINMIIPCR